MVPPPVVQSDTEILADRNSDRTVWDDYGRYRNYGPNPTLRSKSHISPPNSESGTLPDIIDPEPMDPESHRVYSFPGQLNMWCVFMLFIRKK